MADSLYFQQSLLAADPDFLARCLAAAATQQAGLPDTWAYTNAQQLAAAPGFAEKYAYALNAGTLEHPGRDETVIADAEILSSVATILAPPEVPEAPA